MRTKAFGEEPVGSLLDSRSVARASLDVMLSEGTGHILDLRKLDPMTESVNSTELA
jgi:2-C-methyl-D-erythritol 4-phosphate cytidylyltransferase